jgi:hypothetical protein
MLGARRFGKEVFAGESFTGECEREIEGLGESAMIVSSPSPCSHFKNSLSLSHPNVNTFRSLCE